MDVIWGQHEAKYFFGKDWTVKSALIELKKFHFWRNEVLAR
jgi:hypothetical protein